MEAPSDKKLAEGEDFYIENGLYVFTEKYLRERGFCCGSGCRHCPYGFVNVPTRQEPQTDFPQK